MNTQKCSLDLAHLSQQTMGDLDLQRQVLSIFVEQMKLKIPQLAPQMEGLGELAHSIKGSAKGIGAWQVAKAAEEVEKSSGDPSAEIEALLLAVDVSLQDIETLLQSDG
nr:Hpt domain-containing protein [uncultured Cohaesibacter sp.]